MNASDNSTTKGLAEQLSEKAGISIPGKLVKQFGLQKVYSQ